MADEDLLVHVHIPKCGGTSLWMWLAAAHPDGHGNLYPDLANYAYTEDELRRLRVDDPRLRSMSSHNIRTFAATSCGRRMHYFTFIREPVGHFLSYFRFVRQIHEEVRDPNMVAMLPPHFEHISSREFAQWLLDSPRDVDYRDAYQTNFLASVEWRVRTGRGPDPRRREPPLWEPADWSAYRSERLALVKELLRGFAAVGVLERLHDGLTLLRDRSAAWGFDLQPVETVPFENVTEAPLDDVSWITDDDPVGRRFLASIEDDVELHAFAARLLDAGLAERV